MMHNGKAPWWCNGNARTWMKVGGIIFAAGILWMKVDSVQSSVDQLAGRVLGIEMTLMQRP